MDRSNVATKNSWSANSVEGQAGSSNRSTQLDLLTITFIFVTWIAIFPLLVPAHITDRDIFVAVADRLLAGDRLYVDVYDNKDPLFYYFVAAQRSLGGFGEIAFEVILVIIAAASSYALAREITTKTSAAAVSFVAVPIILTGAFYSPGCTHLPGTSLSLAACAFCARRRVTISGVCIGLLVFTKLIMTPVAVGAVACIFLSRDRLSESYKLVLSVAATILVISCVLLARSEFWPFIETTIENVEYSQNPLFIDSSSMWALVASHIHRISSPFFYTSVSSFFLSLFLAIIVVYQQYSKPRLVVALIIASVLTMIVAVTVLVLTGLWDDHSQILYFPSILIAICLTEIIWSTKPILMLSFITSLAFLLGGGPEPNRYVHTPAEIITSVRMLDAISPVAKRLLSLGSTGAYARLGLNDSHVSSLGLNSWKLVCPRFHQYPFQSSETLNKVLWCASAAPTLIVANSIAHIDGVPTWNQFVDDVESLVRSSYNCDAESGVRICTRIGGTPQKVWAPLVE